jgi:hypothetical protein
VTKFKVSKEVKISGFIWLRRGKGKGSCTHYNEHIGSKKAVNFFIAELLA